MLLADANGSGAVLPPLEESTPSPSGSPEPTTNSAMPLPTIATESSTIATPDTGMVGGDTGFNPSWLIIGIIVVALVGGIVTLYLRNRK